MNGLFTYLIVSAASLAVALVMYLPIRHSTWFGINRILLMVSTALALFIPLLPLSNSAAVATISATLPTIELSLAATPDRAYSSVTLLIGIWAMGALAMLIRLLRSIYFLMRTIRKSQVRPDGTRHMEGVGPFSFFNIIVLPSNMPVDQRNLILTHELVHSARLHSFDRLFFEAMLCLQWFNPAAHLLRKLMAEVHEFEADAVAEKADRTSNYAHLIVLQAINPGFEALPTNAFFNQSLTKSRIAMLNRKRTPVYGLMRHLAIFPSIGLMLWINACANGGPGADPVQSVEQAVVEQADQMPEFKGGMAELSMFLGSEIKYPETAKADSTQGTVYISFCVETDGHISDVEVVKGVREDIDQEAIRAVKAMPDWTPGSDKGQPVKVKLTLPVSFRLS